MREIVLDTETTGLDPADGHRLVEIAALELVNHLPTRRHYHAYVNPGREVPADAFAVHGLSTEFLASHPGFADIADALLAFLGDSPLVIHNAEFDLKFLNAELARIGRPKLSPDRAVDTVLLARRKFPGAPAGLDALCRRFAIDLSTRVKHGAMVDAGLLSAVYIELLGGRQAGLGLGPAAGGEGAARPPRTPRPHAPTPEELTAHEALVARLKSPIWNG